MKNYNDLSKIRKYNRLAKIAEKIGKDDYQIEIEFFKTYSNRHTGKLSIMDLWELKLLIEMYAIPRGKTEWLEMIGTEKQFLELAKENKKK